MLLVPELGALLGQGAFGEVRMGTDRYRPNHQVALKTIPLMSGNNYRGDNNFDSDVRNISKSVFREMVGHGSIP